MSERIISERRVSGVSTSCDRLCTKYIIAERNQRNNRIIVKTLVGCLLFSCFFLIFLVCLFEDSCYLHIIFSLRTHKKTGNNFFTVCFDVSVPICGHREKKYHLHSQPLFIYRKNTLFWGHFYEFYVSISR